jgi:pyrroline-5-carboxylate reductase
MANDDGIALIGGGQMALAMADGFCRAGLVVPPAIVVSDPSPDARERLATRLPGIRFAASNAEAAAAAPLVLLAVKPQQAAAACHDIGGALGPGAVVVSIVAGLSTSSLASLLGMPRVIRVMPNTPCLVGKGVSAICATDAVTPEQFARAKMLLAAVGTVHEVPEPLMDAVTGVSGSGPGFVAMFVEALVAGGVEAGLSERLALTLAVETIAGTAALIAQTGESPAVIRERVCSPGGTTLAGLAAMERGGVRTGISAGVVAARDRARELGRADSQ